jgi:hypothetical protein
VDQVDLAQVRLRGIAGEARAVLYRGPGVGVALDAEARDEADLQRGRLGKAMAGAAADGQHLRLIDGHRRRDDRSPPGWQSHPMSDVFHFPSAVRRDPAVDAWFAEPDHEMRRLAQPWFEAMRRCGPDVRELMHDRCPWACVGDAAFGYVNAFSAHANVGFNFGAELDDPAGLLQGAGKRMRHLKLRWGEAVNAPAITGLIEAAYRDMRLRLAGEG